MTMQLEDIIPDHPEMNIGYVWTLDTDLNEETGQHYNDIGSDFNARVSYIDGEWYGALDNIEGGYTSDLPTFDRSGDRATITVPKDMINYQGKVYMVAHVTFSSSLPSMYPLEGHIEFPEIICIDTDSGKNLIIIGTQDSKWMLSRSL